MTRCRLACPVLCRLEGYLPDIAALVPDRRQGPAGPDALAESFLAGAALCQPARPRHRPDSAWIAGRWISNSILSSRICAIRTDGASECFALQPMSVAAFYGRVMAALEALGTPVKIHAAPNELPEAVPFADDSAPRIYDGAAAARFWRVLLQANRVMTLFRTGFLGKASPVHFFWGSFDLAVTRFSGRPAPRHPGGVPNLPDAVTREAYSHEVSSAGFWPGGPGFEEAAFYSYAYPTPAGFATPSSSLKRPVSMRRWANSCCPMRRCAARTTRMRCCSVSWRRVTPQPPMRRGGIETGWNAAWAFRAGPVRSEAQFIVPARNWDDVPPGSPACWNCAERRSAATPPGRQER